MSLAGLGVSLAGFAGIIATWDTRPSSPVRRWRIRFIVIGGLILTFAGFLTIATYRITGDDQIRTVRFMSIVVTVTLAIHYWMAQQPGPEWPDERGRLIARLASTAFLVAWLVNVFVASLVMLQALFLGLLFDPATVFVNAVRDVARGEDPADE